MTNTPTKGIRPHTPPDGQAKPKRPKRPRKRGRVEKVLIATLQFGLIFYAALVVALLLLESRLVYPGAYMDESEKAPLAAEAGITSVEYKSTDRVVLRGRLLGASRQRSISVGIPWQRAKGLRGLTAG